MKLLQRSLILLSAAFLIAACSQQVEPGLPDAAQKLENLTVYPADTQPAYDIRLTPEQKFGDTEEILIGNQLSVSNSGILFIQHGVNIYCYDSEGNLIATMGGKGRGPGEIHGFAKKEMIIQDDRLFIYDDIQYRINIYSVITFEPIGAIRMDSQNLNSPSGSNERFKANTLLHVPLYYPFTDSLLLVRLNPNLLNEMKKTSRLNPNRYVTLEIPSYFYLMNLKGKIVSNKIFDTNYKLKFFGGATGGPPLPFDSRTIVEVGPQGNIYATNTQDFFIKIYDSQGIYEKAIHYPIKKESFDKEDYLETIDNERVRELIQKTSLPDSWPALTNLLVDDEQRLWVATIIGDMNKYEWRVLDAEGELLAQFKWPRNKEIKVVKNDKVYALEEGPETGVDSIVRYGLEIK